MTLEEFKDHQFGDILMYNINRDNIWYFILILGKNSKGLKCLTLNPNPKEIMTEFLFHYYVFENKAELIKKI